MKKRRHRRTGKLIQASKDLTRASSAYRVIGIVDGGEDMKTYGVYPSLALAQQIALVKRNDVPHMTCFVYTEDNRIVFSTGGKE